jgi:hypothetical protein
LIHDTVISGLRFGIPGPDAARIIHVTVGVVAGMIIVSGAKVVFPAGSDKISYNVTQSIFPR